MAQERNFARTFQFDTGLMKENFIMLLDGYDIHPIVLEAGELVNDERPHVIGLLDFESEPPNCTVVEVRRPTDDEMVKLKEYWLKYIISDDEAEPSDKKAPETFLESGGKKVLEEHLPEGSLSCATPAAKPGEPEGY